MSKINLLKCVSCDIAKRMSVTEYSSLIASDEFLIEYTILSDDRECNREYNKDSTREKRCGRSLLV